MVTIIICTIRIVRSAGVVLWRLLRGCPNILLLIEMETGGDDGRGGQVRRDVSRRIIAMDLWVVLLLLLRGWSKIIR